MRSGLPAAGPPTARETHDTVRAVAVSLRWRTEKSVRGRRECANFAFGLGAAVFLTTIAGAQHKDVFQAHTPDGVAYWVTICLQADMCLEQAYKFCKGPYQPLDPNGSVNLTGFRFVCRTAHKDKASDPAGQPARDREPCGGGRAGGLARLSRDDQGGARRRRPRAAGRPRGG